MLDSQHVHLSQLGCIKITGADTDKFLQGQLTIAPNDITQDKLSMGAVCNPQGRCIALFWATRINEDILFVLPQSTIETTLSHLTKYAVFFKTELLDATMEYPILGSSAQPTDEKLEPIVETLAHFQLYQSQCYISICQQIPTNTADANEIEQLQSQWFYDLALAGIPWLETDSQGEFLPHNLNLPELNAVDFKKGCFTGQEVIARMQYKGKLKSHMQLLISDQNLPVSTLSKLHSEGRAAGEVICSSIDQERGTAVLAIVRDKYLENQNFRLNDENGPILKLTNRN